MNHRRRTTPPRSSTEREATGTTAHHYNAARQRDPRWGGPQTRFSNTTTATATATSDPRRPEDTDTMNPTANHRRRLFRRAHRRHRSTLRVFQSAALVCLFGFLALLLSIAGSAGSVSSSSSGVSTKPTTALARTGSKDRVHGRGNGNPFRRERTIVSGFGSRSIKKTVFAQRGTRKPGHRATAKKKKTHGDGGAGTGGQGPPPRMWVQRSNYGDGDEKEDDALWIMVRDDDQAGDKIVLKLSFDDETDDWVTNEATPEEESDFVKDHPLDEWIPVDGLYGAYRVPSGMLWILVTGTEAVYEAPPLASSSETPWWQIRRVTSLEIVHLGTKGYHRPGKTMGQGSRTPAQGALTAPELREEVRQLGLLRKALKQHEFYYVPEGDGLVVRDMTKNIQRSILESDAIGANQTAPDHTAWWGDGGGDDATANRMPDPRFFWNQHAVEPILGRHRASGERERSRKLTGVLLDHVIPLTSAFVGVRANITVAGGGNASAPVSYDEVLISRRSRFRAGTRFTVRGADAAGNCANFAETEQVCLTTTTAAAEEEPSAPGNAGGIRSVLRSVASHVQTRGSIPLRWSSPADIKTYRPRVNIGADPLAQARAVRLHVLDQLRHYATKYEGDDQPRGDSAATGGPSDHADVVFVNLVDKHSDQGRLGRAFDAVLAAVVDVHGNESSSEEETAAGPDTPESGPSPGRIGQNSVKHVWYDFHAEVKNGRWDRLGLLLDDLRPSLEGHGYFLAHGPSTGSSGNNTMPQDKRWTIQRLQNAVVRTNCMDCLDRTNVVQSIFGRYMLFQQLSEKSEDLSEADTNGGMWTRLKKQFRNKSMKLPWETGEVAHRLLWADNADAISRLYAGTPALKGDFTRTGKRTKRGALDDGMNSLQRYYLNNFLDADRQEGYDLLVGYAPFSNVAEEIQFHDDTDAANSPRSPVSFLGGATRQSILSDLVKGSSYHQRSDLQRRLKEIGVSKQPDLDLRWLPGDLQTQLRDQTSDAPTTNTNNGTTQNEHPKAKGKEAKFCSQQAMKAIDKRSHADSPWWFKSDGDWLVVDHEDKNRQTSSLAMNEHRSQVILTPTQLAIVFYLGFKAPSLLVWLTISILSFVYFPDCIENDYQRQKSLRFYVQDILTQKNENDETQ